MKITRHRKLAGLSFSEIKSSSFFFYCNKLYFKVNSVKEDGSVGEPMGACISDQYPCLQNLSWVMAECFPVDVEIIATEI